MEILIRKLDLESDEFQQRVQTHQDSWSKIHDNMVEIIKFKKIVRKNHEKPKNNIFQENGKISRKRYYSQTISNNSSTKEDNTPAALPKLNIQNFMKLNAIQEQQVQNNKVQHSQNQVIYPIYDKQPSTRKYFRKISQNNINRNNNTFFSYFTRLKNYNGIHFHHQNKITLFDKLKRSKVTSVKKYSIKLDNKNLEQEKTPLKLDIRGNSFTSLKKQNNNTIKKINFNNNNVVKKLKIK